MDTVDLDILESRGAAFVRAGPRPPRQRTSSTTARVKSEPSNSSRSRHHSQLAGVSAFGISAYGFILIAAALALATLTVVLVYAATYLYSSLFASRAK